MVLTEESDSFSVDEVRSVTLSVISKDVNMSVVEDIKEQRSSGSFFLSLERSP